MKKLDLLAIGAHPDDIEICCGGYIAKAKEQGYTTGALDLCEGELATRGTKETRGTETELASSALGLDYRSNLKLPDGAIGVDDSGRTQLVTLVRKLRELRPEFVLAPFSQERHPDHVGASSLVTNACFYADLKNFDKESGLERYAPKQVIYFQMRYEFSPSFIVDITSVYAKKQAAIKAYGSQFIPPKDTTKNEDTKSEETLINSSDTLGVVEARDKHIGAMIGVNYGEAFLTRNMLGLKDPISHFRNNPGEKSLFFPAR